MYLPRTQHVQGVGLIAELGSFFASGFGKAITSVATEVAKVGVTKLVGGSSDGGGGKKQQALLQQQMLANQQAQAQAAAKQSSISPTTIASIGLGAIGLLYVVSRSK